MSSEVVTGAITLSEPYDAVKVFTGTKVKERAGMGARITEWVRQLERGGGRVVGKAVVQSSDSEYHCFSVVLFYVRRKTRRRR